MDGMSTQDILNGQDLSTANVDDLLAAMSQGETAPAEEPAPEPKPKRGRKKAAAEPIPDIPNLDEIMAATAGESVASPAETAEADAMAAAMAAMAAGDAAPAAEAPAEEAVDLDAMMAAMTADMPAAEAAPADLGALTEPAMEAPAEAAPTDDLMANLDAIMEPIPDIPGTEAPAEAPVDVDAMMAAMAAGEAAPAAEAPADAPVDVDAMMAAMAAAETATDVDAMMAAMAAGDAAPAESAPEAMAEAPAPEIDALVEPTPEMAAEAPAAEAPVDIDAMMAAMAAEPAPETPAEEAPADAPVDVDAMMAAMAAGDAAPVEPAPEILPESPAPEIDALVEPTPEMAVEVAAEVPDIDPVMAAMIAAGDMPPIEEAAPMEEAPATEMDALVEPIPEMPADTPAENLDAILNAEVDALTGEAPAEEPAPVMPGDVPVPEMPVEIPAQEPAIEMPAEIPAVEPVSEGSSDMDAVMAAMAAAEAEPAEGSAEAPADIDPVAAAMMAAEQEAAAVATVEITEPVAMDNEPEQTPAPMDMDAASDAMEGAVEDIEDFLSSENYEYTVVKNGDNTIIIMKTADGGAMSITYEGNEFDALEPSYTKDGKCGYKEIMNAFVKDTIKNGGSAKIFRHKGAVVVAK